MELNENLLNSSQYFPTLAILILKWINHYIKYTYSLIVISFSLVSHTSCQWAVCPALLTFMASFNQTGTNKAQTGILSKVPNLN